MFDFMFLNLKTFCFLSAVLIAYILFKRGKPNLQGALIIFGVWTLLSIKTMYNYVFPAPSVFPNTRYHHLEHQGFKFNNTLWLVNQADRELALWDDPNHKGALSLKNDAKTSVFQLQSQGFTEPIFVQTEPNSPTFRLSNPILEQNIAQNIEIKLADSFYVKIEMRNFFNPSWLDKWSHKVKTDSTHYICTLQYDGQKATHQSNFTAPLKQGYSVGDILAKTPNLPDLPDWTEEVFGKTYFVRTLQNRLDPAKNATAALVLMPSPALLSANPTILVDGTPQKISSNAGNKNIILPKGQKFYIGFGMQRSPILLTSAENGSKLLYEFGDKKPLKDLDEKDAGLFMTSDSRAVVDNDALAGYYYPLFDSDKCVHHFRAGIQYFQGSAKENLVFRILSYDKNYVSSKVPAQQIGKTIELPSQEARGVTWLFAVHDMRADNPLQWGQMLLLMFVMFGGIALCLYGAPEFSVTEVVVYIVLMAMLTIRSVLLWRMATFAPYEDISYLMYNRMIESGNLLGFTTLKMFQNTFIGVILFFLGIWGFKNWGTPKWSGSRAEQLVSNQVARFAIPMQALGGIVGGYTLLFVVKILLPSLERFGNIFLPLVWFFIIDYLINRNLLETNTLSMASRSSSPNSNDGVVNGFKLLRGINWLVCTGYFAVNDSGFGAIFTIFTILYGLLRTIFYDKELFNLGRRSFLIPLTVLILVLTLSPRIMSWLFIYPTGTGIIVAIALLGGAAAAFWLPKQGKIVLAPPFQTLSLVFAGALMVGAIGVAFKGGDVIRKKSYIKYRSEVLFKKVDDIILNEAAESKNSQKILEAAQNQWFIAYNQDKSDKVWYKNFELLTHFQKGSSYTTQTTDLVTVRYIIGEHGEGLIYLVLLLWFGVVAAIATQWHHEDRPLTGTLLAASVLLFSIALFIWMAATNRFVFFGQDMPLLSLQSLLTLVFALFVLFAVVIGQQETAATTTGSRGRVMIRSSTAGVGGYHAYPIVILTVLLVAFVNKQTAKSIDSFDIADTMDKTKESYERLNEAFEAFQAEIEPEELRKMSEKELLKRFDEQEKLTTSKPNENSILQDPFARSLFKKLKEEDVNKMSPDKILHLRRTEQDGFYKFAVNNQFFQLRSPDVDKNAWRGNVLAPNRDEIAQFQVRAGRSKEALELDTHKPKSDLMQQFGALKDAIPNAKMTFLPGGWMSDKQHLVILRTEKGVAGDANYRFLIQNSREMIDGNSANKFAYALKNHDAVRLVNSVQSNSDRYRIDYARSNYDFWAKNVWLNGKQRFFYPAGEKALWVYHFANLMSLRHNQLEIREKHRNLFANVEISLDPNLTTSVYDDVKSHFQGRLHKHQKVENDRAFNLVAMDGNGRIALMADYKKVLPTRINPNKIERYQSLITKFYLEGNPSEERRIFGNGCLQRLSPGVGSSFKPIVYDAVTSAYNFNWNDLVLTPPVVGNDVLKSDGKGHRILYQYAGKSVGKWTFLDGDKNFEWCTGRDYLAHSSNSYHSLIMFIGSFEKKDVEKQLFFKPSAQMGLSDRFPQVQYGGQTYGFGKWAEDFSSERSLLAKGLHINYDLPLFYKHVGDSARAMQTNLMQGLDDAFFRQTQSSYKLWSFPEYSLFSQVDRNKNKAIEGLRQSTVGGFPVQITPLKMAEMAGKMVSANPAYRATVQEKQGKPKQGMLSVDASWGSEQAFLDFKSNTILASMHQMASQNGKGMGTGSSVFAAVEKIKQYDGKSFHFYSKTGTINSPYLLQGKPDGIDNRLFMLVISKEKLHDRRDLTKEILRDNRFYVLYFSFQRSQGDNVGKMIAENIEKVIQSSSFKNYMK